MRTPGLCAGVWWVVEGIITEPEHEWNIMERSSAANFKSVYLKIVATTKHSEHSLIKMTTKGRPSKRCFDCEADGTSEAAGSRPVRRRRSSSSSTSPGDDEQYHSGSEITSDIELTPACTPEPVPASVESRWFPNGEMPLPVGAPCDAKDCMLPKAAPMHALSQIMAKRSVGSSEANHKETASDLVAAMAHGSEIVDKVYRQAISESFEGMNGPLAPPAESREAIKDYVLSKLPVRRLRRYS